MEKLLKLKMLTPLLPAMTFESHCHLPPHMSPWGQLLQSLQLRFCSGWDCSHHKGCQKPGCLEAI